MLCITFAGHRRAFSHDLYDKIDAAIDNLLAQGGSFVFYSGGMGEFDKMCESAVRQAKRKHQDLDIKLVLVSPYMSNRFNTDRAFYESSYDEILIPMELAEVHYKAVITMSNRWLVDNSDCLIAYVRHDYGGAYATLKYAKKKGCPIVRLI